MQRILSVVSAVVMIAVAMVVTSPAPAGAADELGVPTVHSDFHVGNTDADGDGYFAEPGNGIVDCDDNDADLNHDDVDGDLVTSCGGDCDDSDPDIFPGVTLQPDDVADGMDQDCDDAEECFRDLDRDGQGNDNNVITAGNGDLLCRTNDGEANDANDCDDARANVYLGNPALVAGDGLDQDCNGSEECLVNLDGDPYGIETFVDESPDGDVICDAADGEATAQPDNLFDCDDADPTVHPGVVGDRDNCRNPTGVNDTVSTAQARAITIDVLSNDTDPTGDPLVIGAGTVTSPANGSVSIVAGGIRYAPDPDFVGIDSFTYQPSDGTSLSADPAQVQVTVTEGVPDVFCDGKTVTIDMTQGAAGIGTADDDVILGTTGDDLIDAGAGHDTVCAGAGDDIVVGGEGDDTLIGEAGRDIMRGNTGADVLLGGDGADRLLGGTGGDTLDGGPGDDYLGGFGGNDSIIGGAGNEIIFGGFGADTIDGGSGNDEIHGLIGDDTIQGGFGDDTIDGDRGNDDISGGPGDDIIRGGNANDVLRGDGGNDDISGGKADDSLSGGADTDTCAGNLETTADTTDGTCETIFGVP